MEHNDLNYLFKPLWDDIIENDAFHVSKPLLAHYTTTQVLEKILETDEVWFSNPLFMNDIEEVRFGLTKGAPLVMSSSEIAAACKTAKRAHIFRQSFEAQYSVFVTDHVIDTYVFCLSEHAPENTDGVLSMWRGYGGAGSGAAIVLDSAKLNRVDSSALILARVTYASTEKRIKWLEDKILKFAEILNEADIPDEQLPRAAFVLFERIKLFALFTKHLGFIEENEWRFVYLKNRDPENKLSPMLGYLIGQRGVEPKLKFKVAPMEGITANDLSLEKVVDRIILGPSISSPISRTAVERMLQRFNKASLKERLYASSIPFRHS